MPINHEPCLVLSHSQRTQSESSSSSSIFRVTFAASLSPTVALPFPQPPIRCRQDAPKPIAADEYATSARTSRA
jgi:hypothetical protein